MKNFIILVLFTASCAGVGLWLLHIADVTLKQWILCAVAAALFHPLTDFLIGLFTELFKR